MKYVKLLDQVKQAYIVNTIEFVYNII
jgi:hypothetical protein